MELTEVMKANYKLAVTVCYCMCEKKNVYTEITIYKQKKANKKMISSHCSYIQLSHF